MVETSHYKPYTTLACAIQHLEELKGTPDPNPDESWDENTDFRKATYMTAAAGLIYALHNSVKSEGLDAYLAETNLLERIKKRVLSITTSTLPYPTSEELIKAGKMLGEASISAGDAPPT